MLDLPTLVAAISLVETGDNDLAVGKHGERSRFQIIERVWNHHTHLTHRIHAKNPRVSVLITLDHIDKCIIPYLASREQPITPFTVAGCWNGGCWGFTQLDWGRDYAERVANTYVKLTNERALQAKREVLSRVRVNRENSNRPPAKSANNRAVSRQKSEHNRGPSPRRLPKPSRVQMELFR
jgi:hypothetical protein